MSGTDGPNGTSVPPGPDYEWRYEYYDDEEPLLSEGLQAHRYSIVIGFWVGLAVFVIFMFFLLTLLSKTGAPHPQLYELSRIEGRNKHSVCSGCTNTVTLKGHECSGQPCEKWPRTIGYEDPSPNNRDPSPYPGGLDSSCSLLGSYVSKEGEGSKKSSSSEEVGEATLLQELIVTDNRAAKEAILLAHFNIANCVNSEQSSTVKEDDLLLGAASHQPQ